MSAFNLEYKVKALLKFSNVNAKASQRGRGIKLTVNSS